MKASSDTWAGTWAGAWASAGPAMPADTERTAARDRAAARRRGRFGMGEDTGSSTPAGVPPGKTRGSPGWVRLSRKSHSPEKSFEGNRRRRKPTAKETDSIAPATKNAAI